jgi:MFS family permease
MERLGWIRKIHKTVFLLGAVSLLNDLSGEIIMAVLPLFIVQLGGGGLIVGLIGGLEEAAKSILSVFSGRWSDRAKSRLGFVWLGYGFTSVVRLLLGLSATWVHVLALRVLDRVGKGFRTPARDALIADVAPLEIRGINFGFHRMMDTSGALLGSIMALLLFWVFALELRAIVLVGGAIALASLLPLFLVHERSPAGRTPTQESWWAGFSHLSRPFRLCLTAMTLFSLGNFSYMFMLLKVHLAYASGSEISRLSIGLPIAMYVIYNFTYAMLATPSGWLSDRLGRGRVLVFGYLVYSLVALGFAWAESLWQFVPLFVLYGSVYALIEGNQRALAADLAEPEVHGTALGLFHMSVGLGALAGGLVAGALWQLASPSVTFLYGSALALLGALGLIAAARPASAGRG